MADDKHNAEVLLEKINASKALKQNRDKIIEFYYEWLAFHPEAMYDPETEELLRRGNRRKLIKAYYEIDAEFRKAIEPLITKLKSDKADVGEILAKIDVLLLQAEGRLVAQTIENSKEQMKEREKQLLKLRKDFNP